MHAKTREYLLWGKSFSNTAVSALILVLVVLVLTNVFMWSAMCRYRAQVRERADEHEAMKLSLAIEQRNSKLLLSEITRLEKIVGLETATNSPSK